MKYFARMLPVLSCALLLSCSAPKSLQDPAPSARAVLVFSKTAGFRHESIPDGIKAIQELGSTNGFSVTATEDAAYFNPDSLEKFNAVVFLSPTGDVLNEAQQSALQKYIRGGGGFAGVHAAADCEYDWEWYGKLTGAYFASHPAQQKAKINVENKEHLSTVHLTDVWERKDEWYNYKSVNPDLNILMKLDESSYDGGSMNGNHPIAWFHEFEGGRAWYTGLGHTKASYSEPAFLQHLLGGIRYAMGENN